MKVVGLVSGGKDSCFNLMQCVRYGHEIIALANLRPADNYDEIDSYMYQTVGYQMVGAIAESMQVPFIQKLICGVPKHQDLSYVVTESDEVEDLYLLLKEVKDKFPEVEGVSCGAILSNYQRLRVENVCGRLGLVSLSFLWHQSQLELLQAMISDTYNIDAILVKVASFGLTPEKHLGKSIKTLFPELVKLSKQYELNICGEGGEYESFVLDCPLFKKRIVIDEKETIIHSDDAFAQVAFLRIKKWHLEDKTQEETEIKFLLPPQNNPLPLLTEPSDKTQKQINFNWTDVENNENNEDSGLVMKANKTSNFVYVTGNSKQAGKSADEQIGEILTQVKVELEKMNLSMNCLSFLNVYVNNMADFGKINQEYSKHFGINPPSRACVQPIETQSEERVKVECIGTIINKSVLHVQSISKWAPACIGPYSQAVQVNPSIFLAGQIGLDPPTMQIVKGGYEAEFNQVMDNLQQVLLEVSSNILYCTTISVFCVNKEWIPKLNSLLMQFMDHKLEDSANNDQVESPIITFIELSGLPRKAAVEVVVTSLNSNFCLSLYHSLPLFVSLDSPVFIHETKGLICTESSEEEGRMSFLQTKIGTKQTNTDSLSPLSFFSSTTQHLLSLIQTHVLSLSPLFVRIYYSNSIIGPVVKVFEKEIEKHKIGPVTMIPVENVFFETKDLLNSFCLLCIEITW